MVKVNVEVSDAAGGSWNHFFFVQLHAPEIAATQIVFNDAAFGNGDGLADAGETIVLSVQVKNTGSGDLSNGTSNFQPSNNLLSGSTGSLPVASLKADSTYWLDFMFVVDAGAKDGSICLLNFDLQAQGYSIQEDYYVVVGQVDEDFVILVSSPGKTAVIPLGISFLKPTRELMLPNRVPLMITKALR